MADADVKSVDLWELLRQRDSRFVRYAERNLMQVQFEKVKAMMEEGWRPFKVCGTYTRPIMLMSGRGTVFHSNVPMADHCRVEYNGAVVRYQPRR